MAIGDRILTLATKAMQDILKTAVDAVKAAVDIGNNNNYTPIQDIISITGNTSAQGVSVVLKDITGQGYLSSCYLTSMVNSSGYIQITIDGSIKLKAALSGVAGEASGVFYLPSAITNSGIRFQVANGLSTVAPASGFQNTYGDLGTSMSQCKNLFIDEPISFKQSLKVEFISDVATSKNLALILKGRLKTS
jgi:hypothetical protein